jgi:arsenate reductase
MKELKMIKVIFACVHSAGRSQMAAAFFNEMTDSRLFNAQAAGTEPASKVHPEVVLVMKEVGIDLSFSQPTLLTNELAAASNLLVTMGCGEKCPFVPGLQRVDWVLKDPKGQGLDQVRMIRDEIKELALNLIKANGWSL